METDEFTTLDKKLNEGLQMHARQFDDLKQEFRELRSDLKVELSGIRNDMHIGLNGLRSDLHVEIKDSKVDTIRWTIALFVVLAGMILAVWLKK